MPQCQNCNSFVTDSYVRVFAPPNQSTVRVCPNCEGIVRDGNETRAARSKRS